MRRAGRTTARSLGELLLCLANIQAYADSDSSKYLTTSTPSPRISLPIHREQQRPPATWGESAMASQQLFPATITPVQRLPRATAWPPLTASQPSSRSPASVFSIKIAEETVYETPSVNGKGVDLLCTNLVRRPELCRDIKHLEFQESPIETLPWTQTVPFSWPCSACSAMSRPRAWQYSGDLPCLIPRPWAGNRHLWCAALQNCTPSCQASLASPPITRCRRCPNRSFAPTLRRPCADPATSNIVGRAGRIRVAPSVLAYTHAPGREASRGRRGL
jgi:hypothetical protein